MKHLKRNSLLKLGIIKIVFNLFPFLLAFVCGYLLCFSFNVTKSKKHISFPSDIKLNQASSTNDEQVQKSYFHGYNSTHLWSMRLADENYFRLAHMLPCRIVEYLGPKNEQIDSCDHSSTQEFSIQNTLQVQKWFYEHQHPMNCESKRFAIIENYAWSGFGSTVHQIVWAFVDNNQAITINANIGYWTTPIIPSIFQNRTFNWYRTQMTFYLMRYKPETLAHVHNVLSQHLKPPSIDLHHPYIALYVRRSDKVRTGEMSQAYTLKQYFDLFDADARRANISTIYINSEDEQVFSEFISINKETQDYYKLLKLPVQRNIVFSSLLGMTNEQRGKIILEFLTDLFIEANADLHVGTLTSNWCRLVDEIRLVLGKTIPFYTPENKFLMI
ncbi:unnamed protein product [Rotaria sp. Silwood1]|nr:unnamed protein product [Rotaria sp. Silwood1]